MAHLLSRIAQTSAVISLGLAGAAAARAQTADALPALSMREAAQGHRDGYVLAKPRADHVTAVDWGGKPGRNRDPGGNFRVLAGCG